tara:strand:- start:706 stop:1206 length:501 start_codon:yes stop_codon:yes gene_type:complete
MAQVQKTLIAQPANTPSLEVANHNLDMGKIMSKHFPVNSKAIPQDSAIDYNFKVATLNADDEVIDVQHIKGTQTKGADCMTSKTTYNMTIVALLDEIEGANNPQINKILQTAIDAVAQKFSSVEERVAFWAANGIKWTQHDHTFVKQLRTDTKRVKQGSVKIHPNA